MQPQHGGGAVGSRYEIVTMKKSCCEATFPATKIQNALNQQAAAGRELVWMYRDEQRSCCSTQDCLMLIFKIG
jgi:hypothetical protein